MEDNLEKSPKLGFPDESMEAKYISGLSTVLVATVQEAKDRISQIEYVFCSQLYPHFQAKSKTLQKLYTEARKSAEDDFNEKKKDLLHQIEKLEHEKQQLCDEISSHKLEKKEFDKTGLSPDEICKLQKEFNRKVEVMAEWSESIKALRDEISLKDEILEEKGKDLEAALERYWKFKELVEDLELELENRTKVVDAAMKLQNTLLQMLRSNASIAEKEESLEGFEEKATIVLSRVEEMMRKIAELQEKLKEKAEVERGREMQGNLRKKIELQATEILGYERQSNNHETEKRVLTAKLEVLENDIDLVRKEIRKKDNEIEEGRRFQEQLIKQIDLYNEEKIKTRQEIEELEKEKQQLLAKLGSSEEKPDMLHAMVRERSEDSSEDMELHGKLLKEIEGKDSQLLVEKKKRRDVISAYKKLKSQYNFLCSKYGLSRENAIPQNKMEDESDFWRHNQSTSIPPDPNARDASCEATDEKGHEEDLGNDSGSQRIQRSNSVSPSSRKFIQPKSVTDVKACPPAGTKRPVSYWRDTRSHQSRLGPDLHDDFLDTPLEKIKGDLGNTNKKDGVDYPGKSAPRDMNLDNSDDETQDPTSEHRSGRNQNPPSGSGTSNFKYVEPVRKKSARENLKGIECKQCKKFYDAVLPTGGGKEGDGGAENFRCEHHEGVSRHRYKYAPPLTPEGFWNIGFESEM